MDWFIGDSHLGHTNIIRYCNRPFKNATEMDDTIISNWNQVVSAEDTVYHLGDFALVRSDLVECYVQCLKGKIIMIMGNHDRRKTVAFWNKLGLEAHKKPIIYNDKFILSHEPVRFPDKPNIHGHTHQNVYQGDVSDHGIHICVSVEVINYTPISIDEVRELVRKEKKYTTKL